MRGCTECGCRIACGSSLKMKKEIILICTVTAALCCCRVGNAASPAIVEVDGCKALVGAEPGIAVVLPRPSSVVRGLRVVVQQGQSSCGSSPGLRVLLTNVGRTKLLFPVSLTKPLKSARQSGSSGTCFIIELFSATIRGGRVSLPGAPIATLNGCTGDPGTLHGVAPGRSIAVKIEVPRSSVMLTLGAQLLRREWTAKADGLVSKSWLVAGISTSSPFQTNGK